MRATLEGAMRTSCGSLVTLTHMRNRTHQLRAVIAAMAVLAVAAGCVREVLKGEDPEARSGRLTGDNRRDSLYVRVPWMGMPEPRLFANGRLVRTETIYNRAAKGQTRFTLRMPNGTSASVDASSKDLPDGSLEFDYAIASLPPNLGLDIAIPVKGNGLRPDIDLAVNGAPVKLEPGTEVVAVQLARDAATKIVATPRRPPEASTPPASTPPATTPPATTPRNP